MPRKSTEAERLLLLTLMLESAVQSDDWKAITELLAAREGLIREMTSAPQSTVRQIGEVEERTLTLLRRKLAGVRTDLRNLSAALRIANPYCRAERASGLSLTG